MSAALNHIGKLRSYGLVERDKVAYDKRMLLKKLSIVLCLDLFNGEGVILGMLCALFV